MLPQIQHIPLLHISDDILKRHLRSPAGQDQIPEKKKWYVSLLNMWMQILIPYHK